MFFRDGIQELGKDIRIFTDAAGLRVSGSCFSFDVALVVFSFTVFWKMI